MTTPSYFKLTTLSSFFREASHMGRREANKADKLERLLTAGLSAFREDGFAGASVEKVAAAADVARGTFYLYFPDKTALFAALADRVFGPVVDALVETRAALAPLTTPEASLPHYVAMAGRLAMLLAERADEVRIVFAEARAPGAAGAHVRAGTARIVAETEGILADAVTRGELRPHASHIVALAIVGGVERLVEAALEGDATLDVTQVPAEVTALFRWGVAPPGSGTPAVG